MLRRKHCQKIYIFLIEVLINAVQSSITPENIFSTDSFGVNIPTLLCLLDRSLVFVRLYANYSVRSQSYRTTNKNNVKTNTKIL